MRIWFLLFLVLGVHGAGDPRDSLLQAAFQKIAAQQQEIMRLESFLTECLTRKQAAEADLGAHRKLQDNADPNWNLLLGSCNMSNDCLSSPNYPQNYDRPETCVVVISPTWTGHIVVEWFEVAEWDSLSVDGTIYNNLIDNTEDLSGLVPTSSILWVAGQGVDAAKGWRICSANSSSTTTTTPTQEQKVFVSSFWSVHAGTCKVDADGCIASAHFPSNYPAHDTCTVGISSTWTGSINVIAFDTELFSDFLYVNGIEYTGSIEDVRRDGLHGLVPHGNITWLSDYDDQRQGWKLCRSPASNVSWTCKISGEPCMNEGEPAVCTQQFSDLEDLDGDGSIHNGHPRCDLDQRVPELCGPCRCDVGEEQDYSTYALLPHTANQTYISCSPCARGTFRSSADLDEVDACQLCAQGKFVGFLGQTACEVCGVGFVAPSLGMSACDPCSSGTRWVDEVTCASCEFGFASPEGATACSACAVGYFSAQLPPTCVPCSAGSFGARSGQSTCETCAEGHITATVGQSSCEPCRPGTFAAGIGSAACSQCAEGHFSDDIGMTACVQCGVGRFSDHLGSSSCRRCGDVMNPGGLDADLWVTVEAVVWQGGREWHNVQGASSEGSCGCARGARLTSDGDCAECGEGMVCEGMGVLAIQAGYFASSADTGQVWRCHGEGAGRCPGGAPGTCATHRVTTSIACGECEENTRETLEGSCEPCAGSDLWMLGVAFILVVIVLTCAYFFITAENRAERKKSATLITVTCGQLVTVFQMLGICNHLSVTWPEPFVTVLRAASVLNLRFELFSVGCVYSATSLTRYVMTASGVAFVVLFMVLIHAVNRWTLSFRQSTRMRRCAKPSLLRVLGTIVMSCYISLSTNIFAPFQCLEHPNGQRTVAAYPQVVCWDTDYGDEHRKMVTVAAFVSLVPLGFLSLCIWACATLPRQLSQGDVVFLDAFSFLFGRFQPRAHWYSLVLICRNLGVSLVPLVADPGLELFSLAMLLTPSVVLGSATNPWSLWESSFVDICTCLGFLLIVFLAALTTEQANEEMIAAMLISVFLLVSFLFLCVLLLCVCRALTRWKNIYQFFLCHHKDGSASFARLLKMRLTRHHRVNRKVFLDSDDLRDLGDLFGVVSNHTDTLVVLCTREIFRRHWCLGEMTTARLHCVDTILVLLPDFLWPSQEFIKDLEMYDYENRSLASHGISVGMTQETLSWLSGLPTILLERTVTLSCINAVTAKLVARQGRKCETVPEPGMTVREEQETQSSHVFLRPVRDFLGVPDSCSVFFLVDHANLEAVCTALIVEELLQKRASLQENGSHIVAEGDEIAETAKTIVVVCSNGCFLQAGFARQLCRAAELSAGIVPIVAEGGFRFPTDDVLEELASSSAHILRGTRYETVDLVSLVQQIFQVIAVSVNTHESEQVLDVRVRLILERLSCTALHPFELRVRNESNDHAHAATKERSHASDDVEITGSRGEELEGGLEFGPSAEVMHERKEGDGISPDHVSLWLISEPCLQGQPASGSPPVVFEDRSEIPDSSGCSSLVRILHPWLDCWDTHHALNARSDTERKYEVAWEDLSMS